MGPLQLGYEPHAEAALVDHLRKPAEHLLRENPPVLEVGEAIPATNRLVQPPLELLLRPNDGQPARGHLEPPNEGQGRAVFVALAPSVEPEWVEEALEVYAPALDRLW